jgi:hypothetical protein
MLAPSLVITVCCCAALIQLLKGCLYMMPLLRAVLGWLLLCWLLIKRHIPGDNHFVLVLQTLYLCPCSLCLTRTSCSLTGLRLQRCEFLLWTIDGHK